MNSLGIYLVLYLLSGATVEYLHSVLCKRGPLKCLQSRHLTLLEDIPQVYFQSPFAAPFLFCDEYRHVCYWYEIARRSKPAGLWWHHHTDGLLPHEFGDARTLAFRLPSSLM